MFRHGGSEDHLEPTRLEKNLGVVYALLDELETGKTPPKNYADGFDDRVYCAGLTKAHLDEKVAELCAKLTAIPDVTKYSLELQIWWRDHQKADQEREAREK